MVVVIIGVLTAIAFPALNSIRDRARTVQCSAKMKNLGSAILLYATENSGEVPRSWHSAGSNREPGWAASIMPYLGVSQEQMESDWSGVFEKHFRSPADPSTDPYVFSYALNVHFELNPNGDDYTGAPATWRRLPQIPYPSKTILLGQPKPIRFGDHLMCHQWSSPAAAKNALNHSIHRGRANYLFVDGHVELLPVEQTFFPANGINLWNPSLAGP